MYVEHEAFFTAAAAVIPLLAIAGILESRAIERRAKTTSWIVVAVAALVYLVILVVGEIFALYALWSGGSETLMWLVVGAMGLSVLYAVSLFIDHLRWLGGSRKANASLENHRGEDGFVAILTDAGVIERFLGGAEMKSTQTEILVELRELRLLLQRLKA